MKCPLKRVKTSELDPLFADSFLILLLLTRRLCRRHGEHTYGALAQRPGQGRSDPVLNGMSVRAVL